MKKLTALFALCMALTACSSDKNANTDPDTIHTPTQSVTDSKTALNLLKLGNTRYVKNNIAAKTNEKDRSDFMDGQKPFAIIVACADSRVAPEIFFDQELTVV